MCSVIGTVEKLLFRRLLISLHYILSFAFWFMLGVDLQVVWMNGPVLSAPVYFVHHYQLWSVD